MIDTQKTGKFLTDLRKRKNYTQKEIASFLHVSFQAVSRWENGVVLPSLDLLQELARIYEVTVDEILNGCFRSDVLTQESLGFSPLAFDRFNEEIRDQYETPNPINPSFRGGICFMDELHYLVSRTLEPGHKQEIAISDNYRTALCEDTVSFLLNEMICARSKPLFLSMSFLSGSNKDSSIERILLGMRKEAGKYQIPLLDIQRSIKKSIHSDALLFTTTCIGKGTKKKILPIESGDVLFYLPSNGVHHHGFTLIKALLEKEPELKNLKVNDHTFLDEIMKPSRSYWKPLHFFMERKEIKEFVHITQFGLFRNLKRVLPTDYQAELDLSVVQIPEIFRTLKTKLHFSSYEMLNSFNCGMGMILVVSQDLSDHIRSQIGYDCRQIGIIKKGSEGIKIIKDLNW